MRGSDDLRFELLKHELSTIDEGVRTYDSMLTQIKGWSITAALAVSGTALALSNGRLVLLGIASTLAFLWIDAHHKTHERILIEGRARIEEILRKHQSVSAALDELEPPFINSGFSEAVTSGLRSDERRATKGREEVHLPWRHEVWVHLRSTAYEIARPLTFISYALVVACQVLLLAFIGW